MGQADKQTDCSTAHCLPTTGREHSH